MPNQINSKNTPETYNAGDLNWAHEVAQEDLKWMSTAIRHVKEEIKKIHALAKNGEVISQYHFFELITHLDMYEYLADDRRHYHAKEAEAYKVEREANKKAVTL